MTDIKRLQAVAKLAKYGNLSDVLFQAKREAANRSLYEFIKQGWRYIDPSPFVDGWHIEAVCEHLEALVKGQLGARHLLINQPPRTMKSISVSVALAPWVWAWKDKAVGPAPHPTPPPPPIRGPTESGPINGTPHVNGSHFINPVYPLLGPQVRFLYASYGQHLSLRDSVKARRLIASPWYQENWKHLGLLDDSNTKTRFDNTAGGYRIATSVGGALTGEGGDIVCFDDPHNTVDMESQASIENVLQWWDEAMSTRLNDPKTGAYIGVMQRLRQNDLSGHIISKNDGDWCHLCLPMEYEPKRHCITSLGWEDPRGLDEDGELLEGLDMSATPPRVIPGSPMADAEGELLTPDRFGPDEVAYLKKALGPFSSAGQLQQYPVPEGGGIIKEAWWQMFPQKGDEELYIRKVVRDGMEEDVLSYPDMETVIIYADTAYTEKEENDYSAAAMLGVWRDRNGNAKIMLMRCWQERLELHALVQKLARMCQLTGGKRPSFVDRLIIENKASGKSVAQEIIRLFGSERWVTQNGEPAKGDKIARAYSIQYIFSDKMVFAPDRNWADLAISECMVGNTKVITSEGIKRIDEIGVGDMVLTHLGRFRPVLAVSKKETKKLISLKPKTLDEMFVTGEHPVYAGKFTAEKKLRGVSWVNAEDMIARRYNAVARSPKGKEAVPSACHSCTIPIPMAENPITEIDLRDWATGGNKVQHQILEADGWIQSTHGMIKAIKWKQPLDFRFGRVLGLYIAEGSGSRLSRIWSFNGRNEKEKHLVDEVLSFFSERFGIEGGVVQTESVFNVSLCLPLMDSFFEEMGHGAGNKKIPSWMWNAPDDFLKGVADGYLEGDGCDHGNYYTCTTISFSLAWGMRLLFSRLGRKPTVNLGSPPGETIIMGRKCFCQQKYTIRMVKDKNAASPCYVENRLLHYPVMEKKIIESDEIIPVYNMFVHEDNSYTTTSGIVHNCAIFPKGEHDDLPDSIVGGIRWLRDNGYIEMRREKTIADEENLRFKPALGALYDC